MKRLVLPGIPFVLSMALSLWTAGAHVYWQDSGFFLVAVKELGVLYPPGFALYVLLCKAWTLALWWVDFTYAVHLFSATCAALAAGTIAVAARDLLRTKGPIFHNAEEQGPLAEWVGASVGCLAASGYTFWSAAILAKVYAFYYLILALLIWRLIRADESGKPRDFTGVAVLIGLAWQAHPSATNAGLALILFVAFHRRALGGKGIAWRTALAALCALGPIHLLPILARHGSALNFGNPDSFSGFFSYVCGSPFMTRSGAFGLEGSRVASVFRYGWEEFLGVGVLLVLAGAWRLWVENRRLLIGLAAWVVPVLIVTVIFKLEGQHDFWMVAAWIPLWLLAAVGLSLVGKGREIAVILAAIGTIWAVVANREDLDQRDYTLAETLGRYCFEGIPTNSMLATASDDVYGTTLYLHQIRGERKDIFIYQPGRLPSFAIGPNTYFEKPVYLENGVPASPDGPFFCGNPGDPTRWTEPIPAEELPKRFRRARGQFVERVGDEIRVDPEPYELRLLRMLLLSRKNRADALAREGNLREAYRLYGTILSLYPRMRPDPSLQLSMAVLEIGLKNYDSAGKRLQEALSLGLLGEKQARAWYFLAALKADTPEGANWRAKALASPDLAPELRAKLEGR